MQQQQNKPVLTMKMLLFLCTSIMMMSPVVEGAHVGRGVAATSEATTTKTIMIRRRSVQEEEVLNFNDINNNDADAAVENPVDDLENHDGDDHTTFIDLYGDSNYESTTPIVDPPTNVEPILNYNDINNNNDTVAADATTAAAVDTATIDGDESILNYNDLNNNDAAASASAAAESSEVVMDYNDLTDAAAAVDLTLIDVVDADESSEVIMNYNDLTDSDADADADAAAAAAVDPATIDVVDEPIMNYNGLNDNDAAATAAAADDEDTIYVDVDAANGVVVVRNDNVALEPTIYVSSFDIGICMDHPNLQYITAARTSESCHWVSENVPDRCPLHHTSESADHLFLYELCPVACQQCEYLVPTLTPDGHLLLCDDYPYLQFTTQDGYRRECHWVTQYPALRCQLPYTQQEAVSTDTYLDWLNRKILQDYCPRSCGLCPADYDYKSEESVEGVVSPPSSESSADSFVATTLDPDPDTDPVAVRDTILYGALLEAQQQSQSSQEAKNATASSSSSTTDSNEYVYFSDLYENYESPTTTTTTPPPGTTDDDTTTTQFTDVYDAGTESSNDDTPDDHNDQEENDKVILFTDVYAFSHSADEVCHCDGTRPHCPNPEDEATFVCDDEENDENEDKSESIQFTDMYDNDDNDDNDLESSHDENHDDDHDHEYSEENENENESANSSNSNSNKKKTKISPWVGLGVFLIVVLLIIVILVCDFKVRKRRRRQEATDEQDSGGGMKKKKKKHYLSFDSNIDNNDTSESDEDEIDEQENNDNNENEHENENNDMKRMKKIVLVDVDDGKTIDSSNQNCYPMHRDIEDIEIGDEFSVYKVVTSDDRDQQTRTMNYHPRSTKNNSQRGGPPQRRNSSMDIHTVLPSVEDYFEASSTAPPPHQRGQRSTVRVIETKNTNTSASSSTTKTMREKYEAWADGNLQRHQDKLNNRMRREDP